MGNNKFYELSSMATNPLIQTQDYTKRILQGLYELGMGKRQGELQTSVSLILFYYVLLNKKFHQHNEQKTTIVMEKSNIRLRRW